MKQAHKASVPPQDVQFQKFSTGLCDCCDDPSLCCLTCFFPCITFGRIAEIVDRGTTPCLVSGGLYGLLMYLTGCQCIYSCIYRSKLRVFFGMEANACGDWCVHHWCECCALCQEYRELQHRGYDPALGWQWNVEKRNPGMVPPPTIGYMTR